MKDKVANQIFFSRSAAPMAIAAGSVPASSSSSSKRARAEPISTANLDADDPIDEDDSDASDSDEDDTAQLLAELTRIKKERAQESAKKVIKQANENYGFLIYNFNPRKQKKGWKRKE